jgi:hypothetical protein
LYESLRTIYDRRDRIVRSSLPQTATTSPKKNFLMGGAYSRQNKNKLRDNPKYLVYYTLS